MKEIELVENEEYLKEAQYLQEITELESKINEYKAIQIEDAKYREIVSSLIGKGIINCEDEELIKFRRILKYSFCCFFQNIF